MSAVQRILVIKHGTFGEFFQILGAFKAIRARYPKAHITLLTSPKFESIAQRCSHIDEVILDTCAPYWKVGQSLTLFLKLKKRLFHTVIDLQNSNRTFTYKKYILSSQQWIGRSPKALEPLTELNGIRDLLDDNGFKSSYLMRPNLRWLADDVSELLNIKLIKPPYVVLIPGASASQPEKRWPHYDALAKKIMSYGYEVVTILGPDEQDLSKAMPGHVFSNLSWFEIAGFIKSAQLVVGNDAGPSYLASCLNVRGFAIFGPATSAKRSGIARERFEILARDDLQSLSVAEVLDDALLMLAT